MTEGHSNTDFIAPSDEIRLLREKLARYEASLASTKGRLAAFARLEEIARERRQSTEAVAGRAALEIIERQQRETTAELQALRSQCEATKGELSMLLTTKDQISKEIEQRRAQATALHDEVADALNELQRVRSETDQLRHERDHLVTEVAHLRQQVLALKAARKSETPSPQRRSDDVEAAPASVAPAATMFAAADDAEESAAFDRFFNGDTEKDKARDWILG